MDHNSLAWDARFSYAGTYICASTWYRIPPPLQFSLRKSDEQILFPAHASRTTFPHHANPGIRLRIACSRYFFFAARAAGRQERTQSHRDQWAKIGRQLLLAAREEKSGRQSVS